MLRFLNAEVIHNTDFVLDCIRQRLALLEMGKSNAPAD